MCVEPRAEIRSGCELRDSIVRGEVAEAGHVWRSPVREFRAAACLGVDMGNERAHCNCHAGIFCVSVAQATEFVPSASSGIILNHRNVVLGVREPSAIFSVARDVVFALKNDAFRRCGHELCRPAVDAAEGLQSDELAECSPTIGTNDGKTVRDVVPIAWQLGFRANVQRHRVQGFA